MIFLFRFVGVLFHHIACVSQDEVIYTSRRLCRDLDGWKVSLLGGIKEYTETTVCIAG